MYRSEGELFNRRDAERDLIPLLEKNNAEEQAKDQRVLSAEFVLVDLIEKNSFGWVIRRIFPDGGKQYLAGLSPADIPEKEFQWLNSQHNSELFPTEFKDVVMKKLKEVYPDSKFEAKELYWEEA
jgi:hypothetical protein